MYRLSHGIGNTSNDFTIIEQLTKLVLQIPFFSEFLGCVIYFCTWAFIHDIDPKIFLEIVQEIVHKIVQEIVYEIVPNPTLLSRKDYFALNYYNNCGRLKSIFGYKKQKFYKKMLFIAFRFS